MADKRNVVMFPGVQRTSFVQAAVQKGLNWSGVRHMVQLFSTRKWTFVLMTVGFLLGRAVILESLTPFAVAYFAVIYFLRRDAYGSVALSIIAGSFFAVTPEPMWIAMELAVVFLLFKGLEAYERAELSYAPILVFVAALLVRLFGVVIADTLSWYEFMMVTVEAALSFVLTLVFIQAIPILTMTQEDVVFKE